ncbi:MAG: 30S ribosomal protein S19 [Candidatus Nanoarchaeia archaeon]|nr:30S ribosomal protein S19 [Candidatus Nanoarchaeia archaeon]
MAKKFTYMGKSMEELKKMSLDEFTKVLDARARRSIKRGMLQKKSKLFEKINKYAKELEAGKNPKPIKVHRKDIIVIPSMVGLTFGVHTGKEFKNVLIIPQMLGHYLGEFVLTRKRVQHSAPGVGATRSSMFVPIK